MSDIATRLRDTTEQMACTASVDMALWDKHSNACLEAADEIEKLRAEYEYQDRISEKLGMKNEVLNAENEKLRAALKPFGEQADNTPWTITPGMMFAAAAALKETGDES